MFELLNDEQPTGWVVLDRSGRGASVDQRPGDGHDPGSYGGEPGQEWPVRVARSGRRLVQVGEDGAPEEGDVSVRVGDGSQPSRVPREEMQSALDAQATSDDIGPRRSVSLKKRLQQLLVWDVLLVEEDDVRRGSRAKAFLSRRRHDHLEVGVGLAFQRRATA